jgi:hypothetical protein
MTSMIAAEDIKVRIHDWLHWNIQQYYTKKLLYKIVIEHKITEFTTHQVRVFPIWLSRLTENLTMIKLGEIL